MRLLGPTITMEGTNTDPFQQLEGVYSTSSNPVYQGSSTTSGTTTSYHNELQEIAPYTEAMEVLSINSPISSNSTTTTSTTASNTVATPSSNSTTPILSGMFGGGLGSGSGSQTETTSGGSLKKDTLFDKWKKLSDWKKGLIILAVATGSYYGYKKINK